MAKPLRPHPGMTEGQVQAELEYEFGQVMYFSLEKIIPTLADKVWQNLDLERFHTEAGYPLQPYVLRLDDGLPGAYQQFSPLYSDQWVGRHRGYAVQWFGLALVLLIGSVALAWTHRVKR